MATLSEQLSAEREYNDKLKEERQKLLLELQEKNKQTQNQTYLKALQADYPDHNIHNEGCHLKMTSPKGIDYNLAYFRTFDNFLWTKTFDQTCRTVLNVITFLEALEHTVLQNYQQERTGALIDDIYDRCHLFYYEDTGADEKRWKNSKDKSQLHLNIEKDAITGFLDWDATYKEDACDVEIALPDKSHLNIYNEDYRPYDKDTLKLSLSHTFRTPIQNFEKALKKAMAVKNNAPLTLKETSSNEDVNTFIITQKG